MREGIAAVGRARKSHFKSGLMVGAAGLAAAGVSTAAVAAGTAAGSTAPKDSAKWLPYASVGGGVGDATAGAQANLFVPVWQDLDSLLFVRLGVGTQTRDNQIANFGLGYRTKVDPEWIVGFYGGFDASHTKYGHTFTQGTIGAELMSADWDVRINGYLATSDKFKAVADKFSLYVHDTRIAILQGQEGSYSGFDGEVGYRIYATDNADFRVFAGGFSFSRNDAHAISSGRSFDFSYRDITGPMGRAEVDIYDLDALGAQSRVTISGQISHDDVRGTSGYVGASLRIPLGAGWGAGGQALDDLDRRMVDPVRGQDNVLTQWDYTKPEPVIIYNGLVTSQPTNTVYYVSDDTLGAGTYANPTSLAGATGGSATDPFIVVTDFGGPVTGATIHAGQTVVGGGGTFSVRGAESYQVFSHDFAPASGAPSLVAATPGGTVITIDGSNASIHDLTLSGDFGTAIYGHNVSNVDIANVTIDGSGGGLYGVQVSQDTSQDMNLHISDTTITGLGLYGVSVNTNVSDGGTSNQTIEITNSTISGSGVADVALSTTTSGGSTVNQSILVDPTYISGGYYGLAIAGAALGAGSYVYQNIAISDVHISGTTYAGIGIVGVGLDGGAVTQKIALTNVTVDGSYAPIFFSGVATYGGSVEQQIDLTNVTATNASWDENISVRGFAYYGGSVHQFGTWAGVTANYGYDDGVEFGATASYGGSVIQNFAISGLTAIGNYDDGLDIYGFATDFTGTYGAAIVAQYFTVDDATLVGNYYTGLRANTGAAGYYAATLQSLLVTNSTIGLNGMGISGRAEAFYGGSAQQIATFDNDTVVLNYYGGGDFLALGVYNGFASQTVNIYNSTFSYNGGDGLSLRAVAVYGANAEQNANIYYSTFDYNTGSGLYVGTYAAGYSFGYYVYYSQVTQNVIAAYDSFSHNGGDGAYVYNEIGAGGQLNQLLYFYGSQFDHNYYNGLLEVTLANAYGPYYIALTNVYSDLYVIGSTANHNGYSGIYQYSYARGPSYLIQYTTVSGTDASYNGFAGFGNYAVAVGFYSLNLQDITLSGSYFDANSGPGGFFVAYQYYGPGASLGVTVQAATILYSDFSYNGGDGLYSNAEAVGYQGRVNQSFFIVGSRFNYNYLNGLEFIRYAHDGYYVPGYGCDANYQSLYGGCAMVRQNVFIAGSDASYNGLGGVGDGILVKTFADNYGAVYDTFSRPGIPTLIVSDTTANGNYGDGLAIYNSVTDNSYLFQYLVAVDSTFDGNAWNGIGSFSYVGGSSSMLQLALIYSYAAQTSASLNAHDGIFFESYAAGGSLALSEQLLFGIDIIGNGSYAPYTGGVVTVNDGDGTGLSVAYFGAYFNALGYQNIGIANVAYSAGSYQFNYIGDNLFLYNYIGIYGLATTGAYQYFDISTYPNTFYGNTYDTYFYKEAGSTQIIH